MATALEFGSMSGAREAREEHAAAVLPADDARTKTVRLDDDDLTDRELDQLVAEAEAGRAERQGAGQVPLTDAERDRIDFSEGRASVPNARSVKAIMQAHGVGDWLAHYDTTLSVDEHREIAARESGEGGVHRVRDPDDPGVAAGRARQVEAAMGEQCDHARNICKLGDPDACEFLAQECGLSEAEIDAIRMEGEAAGEAVEEAAEPTAFTGPQLGALRRSWGGYKGALADLRAGRDVEQAEQHARDAFAAINAIRAEAGQPPLEPEELPNAVETGRATAMPSATADGGSGRSIVAVALLLAVLFGLSRVVEDESSGSSFPLDAGL